MVQVTGANTDLGEQPIAAKLCTTLDGTLKSSYY
jgi:hypothetical protein